jgi:hypothetical protein
MERYVNKGSPSGYTFIQTTSSQYAPLTGSEHFSLPYYSFPRTEVIVFGEHTFDTGPLSPKNDSVPFPIHPDMINVFASRGIAEFSPERVDGYLQVIPMANGRTVLTQCLLSPFYIKLHYEGVLGRVYRSLPREKAIAGPEISKEIEECIDKNLAPTSFAFLREPQARIKLCDSGGLREIGVTFREATPYPRYAGRSLIPFFALFSCDRHNPSDPLLLAQILDLFRNPKEALVYEIIEPILQCYKFLTFDRGLIPEINAQNILLEIGQSGTPTRIVHRDLQGCHKDLVIRRSKGLPLHFDSSPYRCLDEKTDFYYKRHSYCYDFRLGCHILDELVEFADRSLKEQKSKLQREIAILFHDISDGEDLAHFSPLDKWYAYDKSETLLTSQTSYKELDDPKYRIAR